MSENDVETENVSENSEASDVDYNNATTPHYNEPEDADRYPAAIPSPIPAHTVFKGNPEIDGPYLDDVHEAQADARRRADSDVAEIQRRKAEEGQQVLKNLEEANAKLADINSGGEPTTAPEDVNSDPVTTNENVVGEDAPSNDPTNDPSNDPNEPWNN